MMGGLGFMAGRIALPQRFEEQYHCYSAAYADKEHLEQGDKILLPPSAFDILARLQVDYPMLFQLQSPDKGTLTHCGVLEFTAEEGSCVVPFWMMQNLLIEEGAVLTVSNVSLPKANFVKFQAQHVDFLEISNPRAVLEHGLRNFSCITKGDVICVPYNSKNYHFEIKEVRPQDAACIIETDCNVDFDAPVGYKEPDVSFSAPSSGNEGGGNSAASSLANLPKQSAFAPPEQRTSACPSPTPSSLSAGSSSRRGGGEKEDRNGNPTETNGGIRIVDGKVVRSDPDGGDGNSSSGIDPDSDLLAARVGASGVQRNAAVAVQSPTVDYWAVTAGDGARLDGKQPAALKDKSGTAVDVRKLRAEAAALRAKASSGGGVGGSGGGASLPSSGKTIRGEEVRMDSDTEDAEAGAGKMPVRRNKGRVGGKFSRLKSSGGAVFHGGSNKL